MKTDVENKKKVLILNGDIRNGLAILRSLGPKGCICDITATGNTNILRFLKQSLKSTHARHVYFLPDMRNEQKFLLGLIELLKNEKYDYLFCSGTLATNIASKHKITLTEFVEPLVEDFEKLWLIHDKTTCLTWAKSIGIPVPETFLINNLDELKRATEIINYPVVVKYPDSFASQGLWTFEEGGEKLFQEYIVKVPEINLKNSSNQLPFIQEKISGSLMDTTAFAINGNTISVLSQERLLTAWLDGGGGLVNITNDIREIKDYTMKMLKELNWTGPIEMDWIVDPINKKYCLIEINPKFWGTTQLTISAGLDYPYWLYLYAETKKTPTQSSYIVGLMGRWIFDELQAIVTIPTDRSRLLKEIKDFIKRFKYKPSINDLWLNDPKPSILNFIYFCKATLSRGKLFTQLWRLIFK